MKHIGVIGAGIMGSGVAQNLAQTGHRVLLIDRDETILDKSRSTIQTNLRFAGFFGEQKKTVSFEKVMERIIFTTDFQVLEKADFVVENVTENWEIKQKVYAELDRICPEPCIFASNTSAIPITRIGAATNRADKVLGIHFMNPVPLKTTVEMIRGYHTSQETITRSKQFLEAMGKKGILVNDGPGFVTNRILMLTVNEAIFVVQDQVAPAEDVDAIFKSCFEHKMGPLETADLIGLDTILYSLEVLYDSFNDGKYRPCPLLKKMVAAGLLGRKSGQGFYTY